MAAVVGTTLLKMFPEVLHHSPDHLWWNIIYFLSDPFLKILTRSRIMFKNLSFRYPFGEKIFKHQPRTLRKLDKKSKR